MADRDSRRTRVPEAYGGCEACGADRETRYVEFHQHIGLVVIMLHSSVKGELCRDCISQNFWATTGVTLVAGWWGCLSFVITPFVLVNNLVRFLLCQGMDAPAEREEPHRRPRQLVGQDCAICAGRISDDYDAEYCRACDRPAHIACTRPGAERGCAACGATSARDRDDW